MRLDLPAPFGPTTAVKFWRSLKSTVCVPPKDLKPSISNLTMRPRGCSTSMSSAICYVRCAAAQRLFEQCCERGEALARPLLAAGLCARGGFLAPRSCACPVVRFRRRPAHSWSFRSTAVLSSALAACGVFMWLRRPSKFARPEMLKLRAAQTRDPAERLREPCETSGGRAEGLKQQRNQKCGRLV